jgi:Flp pilus assembly protein TadD
LRCVFASGVASVAVGVGFVRVSSRFTNAIYALVAILGIGVSGCAEHGPELVTASLAEDSLPTSQKLVHKAQEQFAEGYYGSAADSFAKTIERDPLNAEAWLGLAAAYDQINRFDEADRAYARVQELIGATPSVLNNLGYSYLLRGNLDKSRRTLAAAYRADPGNPYIQNNIDILNNRLASLGQSPLNLK